MRVCQKINGVCPEVGVVLIISLFLCSFNLSMQPYCQTSHLETMKVHVMKGGYCNPQTAKVKCET